MIKKMDWALSTGQMDANFMVIGQTDDNMAGESTIQHQEKRNQANGYRENA